jgi:fructokinase
MILVCGEALVDVFVGEGGPTRFPADIVVGGSPFNVALGLARLGEPAAFFSGLSTDRFGEVLRDVLASEGVDVSLAPAVPNPTTMSIVARGADGNPRYAFYGDRAADRCITVADLPAALGPEVAALAMGSYTLAVDPVGEAYLALARREKGRRTISLDPNLRPSIVGDLDAWASRFDAFAATATIVKSSDEDIAIAYRGTLGPAEAARRWQARGAELVVVTRGGEGALAFLRDEEPLALPGRRVAVVDTVGAGDTFHAALLASLSRGGHLGGPSLASLGREALAASLAYAVTAASITCSRRGADLPRAADVDAALAGKDVS